ncbi:MAG: septal ring lytic transglycosylase RlpA family protein [Terracidiphilus sp.]
MTRNANNVNQRPTWQLWLLMVVSGVALGGTFVTLPTRTVLADAVLSRPTAAAAPAPVVRPTPVFTEDIQAERKVPAHLLHGFASWYGSVFHGRKTASGETFDMNAMTACHPTLPFGSLVRVVNLRNHRSVIVRITDRGLLYNDRIMDLSYAAAAKLGMIRSGVAPVKIQILTASTQAPAKP